MILTIETDSQVIFDWRNDELTRSMFRAVLSIWETHFNDATNDRCYLLIWSMLIVLSLFNVLLSINVAPQMRVVAVSSNNNKLFQKFYSSVSQLFAEISTQNNASRKSFEKVGFSIDSEQNSFCYISLLVHV